MAKEMTSKERVTAAIHFLGPDRIPIKIGYISHEVLKNPAYSDILCQLSDDFSDGDGIGWYNAGCKMGTNIDEWQCEWLNLTEGGLGQVVKHPLDDISKLNSYVWPKAEDVDMTYARERSENRGDKYYLSGYISIYERMIFLRGFENLLMDIALGEEHFYVIRDKILEYNLALMDRMLELNPYGIFLADDWGSQRSLMINPDAWRKLFLPVYKEMFSKVHEKGKDVFFHSDGYVTDILPDLTEAGVNVFWVEFGVNKLDELKNILGGKAAFLSLPDTQIIEFGTDSEIEAHAKEQIYMLGDYNGGFITYPYIEDNKRSLKLFESYMKYSKYPL